MAECEAWVGRCHLQEIANGKEYRCLAAVWADSAEAFHNALNQQAEAQGWQIIWAEEVLTVSQYLSRHGTPLLIAPVARAVHPGHLVEFGRKTETVPTKEPEQYLTIAEHSFFPLPDQPGIPSWERKWIAQDLKNQLFGQPKDGPALNTYLIVDAGLRKNVTGLFDLDDDVLDVPVQSLFSGQAAQNLRENAPYILDMTLPDGAWDDQGLVPAFHIDFFKRHWDEKTGICIRSREDMNTIRSHFRKFTRVAMEDDGRWVYFRFADPRIISTFIEALDEEDLHKFLGPSTLIVPASNSDSAFLEYRATRPIGDNQRRALPAFIMKNSYIAAFSQNSEKSFTVKLREYLEENSVEFNQIDDANKPDVLDGFINQAKQYGLKIELAVANFVTASLMLGQDLTFDPQLKQIIASDKNQIDKGRLLLQEVRYRMSPAPKAGEA